MPDAAERARLSAEKIKEAVLETPAAAAEEKPPEPTRGYIVKGSDEFSYRACGSSKVYFVRAQGEAGVRLNQVYRFSAASPLSPVYFELEAHFIDDTTTVGDNRYTAIAEVRRVETHPGKPVCPQPLRGSFIRPR